MTTVHILTKGFVSPNGIAFLFPFHVHRRRLADIGIRFRCFSRRTSGITDCDALIIDSRFYSRRWAHDAGAALDELSALAEQVGALLYFDTSDSTGWLQAQVLPIVSLYCKAQLLRDREAYCDTHYGNRVYADFYYRNCGVEDDDPVTSVPVTQRESLKKLRVSWHSGLANYSIWGPTCGRLRRYLPVDALLRLQQNFTPASRPRSVPFACRFGVTYARATVAYQRRRIREALGVRVDTCKLPRRAYFAEMQDSRAAVSPFGFGEITLKDFEAFLCGALLFKPDMAHLETWPDLFRDGETMVAHRWDLSDLDVKLDSILADDLRLRTIAENGQSAYRFYLTSEAGYEEFCCRFHGIVRDALAVQ